MAKRLVVVLFVSTAFATLIVGLATFKFYSALLSPLIFRWLLPSFIVFYFAAPTIFLLASFTAVWSSHKSTIPRWATASVVFAALMFFSIYRGLGWKSFSEAAGFLISGIFVLGSFARQASTIAGIGTVAYAVFQGQELIYSIHDYWAFGGSYQRLLTTLSPPVLVAASLIVAIFLHFKTEHPLSNS
jgi:hypothetical protein